MDKQINVTKTPALNLGYGQQKVMEWLPRRLAEPQLRKMNGELLDTRLVGFDKNMEPIYSYLVAYDKPTYVPRKIIVS